MPLMRGSAGGLHYWRADAGEVFSA